MNWINWLNKEIFYCSNDNDAVAIICKNNFINVLCVKHIVLAK